MDVGGKERKGFEVNKQLRGGRIKSMSLYRHDKLFNRLRGRRASPFDVCHEL